MKEYLVICLVVMIWAITSQYIMSMWKFKVDKADKHAWYTADRFENFKSDLKLWMTVVVMILLVSIFGGMLNLTSLIMGVWGLMTVIPLGVAMTFPVSENVRSFVTRMWYRVWKALFGFPSLRDLNEHLQKSSAKQMIHVFGLGFAAYGISSPHEKVRSMVVGLTFAAIPTLINLVIMWIRWLSFCFGEVNHSKENGKLLKAFLKWYDRG